MRLVDQSTWDLLDWFGHYKRQLLPVDGGLLDQSAPYIESMRLITSYLAENHGKH